MGITAIILLIIIGVVLLLVEIIAVPGIGIPGFIGFFLLVLAIYFGFEHSPTTGYYTLIAGAVISVILSVYAFRAKTWQKVAVKTNITAHSYKADTTSLQIGQLGTSITRINPMGKAQFEDLILEVKSTGSFIEVQKKLHIVNLKDGVVTVEEV